MKIVFFGPTSSIVKWAYNDVINCNDIEYCEFYVEKNSIINRILLSNRFLRKCEYYIQKNIFSYYLNYNFLKELNDDQYLFVFTCQYGMFFETYFYLFINLLKKVYKNSKYAFYYNDLIETCNPEKYDYIKKSFDLVLTFDKCEAKRYEMEYYGEVHSKNTIENRDDTDNTDFFYVGSDRGRFELIRKIFVKCSENNHKAIFYVNDLLEDSINYIKNKYIELEEGIYLYNNSLLYCNKYCYYPKTLSYLDKIKCYIEVLLPNQTAGSLRIPESIMYNKKLITNCNFISEKEYYNENNFFVFNSNSIKDITIEDIENFLNKEYVNIDYDFSPLKMIDYIVKRLFGNNIEWRE